MEYSWLVPANSEVFNNLELILLFSGTQIWLLYLCFILMLQAHQLVNKEFVISYWNCQLTKPERSYSMSYSSISIAVILSRSVFK